MNKAELTGYPSIDKPWLKYYSEEARNAKVPKFTIYEYLWENSKKHLNDTALNCQDRKVSYGEMFEQIERAAHAYVNLGVNPNDVVVIVTFTTPQTIYSIYALNRIGAIPNLIDPRTSSDGIRKYILETNAKYVLTLDILTQKMEQAITDTDVQKIITISTINRFTNKLLAIFK